MIVTPIIPTLASPTRNNPAVIGVKLSTSVASFFWDFQTDLGRHISWNILRHIYHGISIKALNREVGDANGDAAQNDHAQQLLRKQKPCCFTATSQHVRPWQYIDMTIHDKIWGVWHDNIVQICPNIIPIAYIYMYISLYHYISACTISASCTASTSTPQGPSGNATECPKTRPTTSGFPPQCLSANNATAMAPQA